MSKLTAIVLAGGKGTRLRPIVSDVPKPLAQIRGRPFLSYLLDQLITGGAEQFIISTGYMADAIETEFQFSYKGRAIKYSRETTPLGTGGAIKAAARLVDGPNLLVANGDSYFNTDLKDFCNWAIRLQPPAAIMLCETEDTSAFGSVRINEFDQITCFEEKTNAPGQRGWINAGIYMFTSAFISSFPSRIPLSLERDVFPAHTSKDMLGYRATAGFIDIGTPSSYAIADSFFRDVRNSKPDDIAIKSKSTDASSLSKSSIKWTQK